MIEHRLHQRLAVVEGAFDRERVHVAVRHARHHPPLHLGDAAMRIEHDEIDAAQAAKRLDRGAAGIAGGRDDDGRARATTRQRMIHQAREQLHRDVLEGERRPVKQFQHEAARPDLGQRRHRRMAEARIGVVGHAGELGVGDLAAGERPDDLGRDLGIGTPEQAADLAGRQRRPGLGHIEAAVAGKSREHHVAKAECGGLAPGRNVTQVGRPSASEPPGRLL